MEITELIESILDKHKTEYSFTGGETQEKIEMIGKMLNITLPSSYKWFLSRYGHGGILGINIFGGGKANYMTCVDETNDYNKYGLPYGFVAIENCDEWLYVLDTTRMKDGECPVVVWDQISGIGKQYWNTFYDFFLERLNDATENIE